MPYLTTLHGVDIAYRPINQTFVLRSEMPPAEVYVSTYDNGYPNINQSLMPRQISLVFYLPLELVEEILDYIKAYANLLS